MIVPTTPSFYTVNASDEAAELIASVFSPGSMGDIENVQMMSREFTNDIEPMNEIDETMKTIKMGLGIDLQESTSFNPLYIPSSIEELHDALDVESRSDNVRFVAMGGDPFAVKTIELQRMNEVLVYASVNYKQFDLPGYDAIMDGQKTLLN